ncbi:reverse transcriptase domain-containing protein [Tanacetum coccineum]
MDDEPMWAVDHVVAPTPGSVITIPKTANEFAIKGNHLTLVKDTENEAVRLMMFPLSLTGEAKTWLDELNEGTIETWDELRTAFISRFFPPALFDHLLREIRVFSQHENESLTEAWLCGSNTDTDKIMARMDAQHKELQSQAKQPTPDLNYDDIPMSHEEEAKFMQTFYIPGICPSFCKHKIQLLDDKKLVVQKQRRLNPNMQEVFKKEIVKLLDTGIIYLIADSPWVSPIHYVPKKGGITVVTNKNDELVPTRTITGWRNIEVFMDDFSVFGDSLDKCLNNLDKMLQRCKDDHLVLNWEKCHFMVKEGIVLGHKVSGAGLELDKAKIDVILKLPPPTNIKGVRSFLGHARFYRRFIKDFSKIARPLTKLLEKDTPFEFNDECQKAFKLLKEKLTCAPVIVIRDEQKNQRTGSEPRTKPEPEPSVPVLDFEIFSVLGSVPPVLDPTKKCHLLAHGFRKIISYDISKEKPMSNKELESKVEDIVEEVKTKMGELFGTYKERFDFLLLNSSMGEHMESEVTSPNNGDNDFLNDYYNVDATSSYETETELDRYLREPKIELRKGQSLDILQWWKVNGPRFPIVSKMARDILAIQISTVASEAAFSTGGRVLDPYRTRLSTTIVEALICTQDWVRKSRTQINWDDVEDLIKDDEIVKDMEEQLEKLTERDKAKQTGEI